MPVYLTERVGDNSRIGLWKVEESVSELAAHLMPTSKELEQLSAIHHDLGQSHWLAARLLLGSLMGERAHVTYDQFGKPTLANTQVEISLSHSGKFVAAIVRTDGPTGVDVQEQTSKIERIENRFLSTNEQAALSDNGNRLLSLHVYWCAKEALYKHYARKKVDFRTNLYVHPFVVGNRGEITGSIDMPDCKVTCSLEYRVIEDYVLVYVLND